MLSDRHLHIANPLQFIQRGKHEKKSRVLYVCQLYSPVSVLHSSQPDVVHHRTVQLKARCANLPACSTACMAESQMGSPVFVLFCTANSQVCPSVWVLYCTADS
jgi:hypothetical protein